MRKKIGISGNLLFDTGGMFPGYARAYVNDDYVDAVIMAGGTPVILPVNKDADVIDEQLTGIDALILSGGYDVNPQLYGEEPHVLLGDVCDRRDCFDAIVIQRAMEKRLPILGICRGIQILNVVFGGTLYQDCSEAEGSYIKHNQEHIPNRVSHSVHIVPDTELSYIMGDKTTVNSFHHMAVREVAPGFRVSAVAPDGIIEGLESTNDNFVLAVQWHPEMLHRKNSEMLALFQLLVAKAEK